MPAFEPSEPRDAGAAPMLEVMQKAVVVVPRVETKHPETRDIVQTVYIRRVEKVDGKGQNVEIDKIENVKDPAKM
jgi:hypothetical protein